MAELKVRSVEVENLTDITPQHWQAILTHLGNPTDEIGERIFQYGYRIESGVFNYKDFPLLKYLGWRHLNRINSISPEAEHTFVEPQSRTLKERIWLIEPEPPEEQRVLEDGIAHAGRAMRYAWSTQDQIYFSTRGYGNPNIFKKECVNLIWDEEQRKWSGFHCLRAPSREWVNTGKVLTDEELDLHLRFRWLMYDMPEIVSPIHTSPETLDNILTLLATINRNLIRERMHYNRKLYYEGAHTHHPRFELDSYYLGVSEEPLAFC